VNERVTNALREAGSKEVLAPRTTPARRGRVLIIDDEPAMGHSLRRFLEPEYDVIVVVDARDALPRIEAGEVFDIVFCDLMMTGMTGMDFFEALRKTKPDLARKVVFLTGGAFTPKLEDFLDATTNAVLTKPVEPLALRHIVAEYVGRAA
jgi:CheY-like chemotaxis protein